MTDRAPETSAPKSPTPAMSGPSSPAAAKSPTKSPSPGPASPGGILPAEHWAQVPMPEDDTESAMGESSILSTSSITSSILNYRTLHGRSYHSDVGNAAYWGSNDEQQLESMDMEHHALTLGMGNKLHLAPLDKGKVQKVLDIGTGTGLWAIDFADEFSEAEVTGTDISVIQSTWIPPNLRFEIEDCTLEWTFAPDSMDYIHMRWLVGSIADWDALFVEAYKTCRPGGWVESHEASATLGSDHATIPDNSAIAQWCRFFVEGGKKLGRPFTVVPDGLQRKAMEAAGFTDIEEFEWKKPFGTWPKDPVQKEMGGMTELAILGDAEGYVLFLANTLGWSQTEVQVFLAHLRREVRSNKYCPYYPQKVIWGRKPE